MIEFKNVSKEYPPNIAKEPKVAIYDVSFSVSPGEFVILCGRSGAGKTTILKLISCEENPTKGDVLFNGINTKDVKKSEAYKIRQKIGFVFQDFQLFWQAKTPVFHRLHYPGCGTALRCAGAAQKSHLGHPVVGTSHQLSCN